MGDRKIDLRSYAHLDIQNIQQTPQYSQFFRNLIKEKKWYDFIIISDLNGNIVFSVNTEIEGNISGRTYFQTSKKGQPYNSGIFRSSLLHKPVMMLSHPLKNKENAIIGVIAASLNLDNFYNLLFDLRMGKTSELFLVDEQGTLLSPTRLGGKPLVDKGYSKEGKNPHQGNKGVKTHYDYRGKKVLCAYQKLPDVGFYLVSEIDLDEALLPVKQVNRIILYVFLPFFILLVFISNFHSRRITSLLRKLTSDLKNALREAHEKKKKADSINIQLKRKISECGQLTQELKHSEDYIRNLIDSISLGVVAVDRSGKITHYNKEFKDSFPISPDYKEKEISIYTLLPWFNDKDVQDAFQKTLTDKKPHRIEEKEIHRDEKDEYFNLSFFPIDKDTEESREATLLIENVTERKRLRKQLAQYEKLSALSQLALGAAHEINNPLLGISSYLENIADETSDEKSKEEIELVLENVYRISETIRGLLNFARPSPPQFTKVNINQLVDETLSFLHHQPIFRKISIEKNLSTSLPPITADLNQIRQVLINIFINAAQSMPNGGELKVLTSKVKFKEFIQIDIQDTGQGIPQNHLKKIFDPFFTTKKRKGTGLGLSISLSYIKNHKGNISVKSQLNKGTTFSLFLPIRQKGKKTDSVQETIT